MFLSHLNHSSRFGCEVINVIDDEDECTTSDDDDMITSLEDLSR